MKNRQFIGYHVDHNYEDGIPIAVGDDKQAVLGSTIRRIFGLGLVGPHDHIAITERKGADRLKPDEFAQLQTTLDTFFAEKGIHA
jgi:hypothetical protein